MPIDDPTLIDRVTMLVPTRNRQGYLKNILETYKNSDLKIIVADTSPTPFPGAENSANVRYRHFTECSFLDVLRFLVESATTEYIVLRAENRHITLNGIMRCLKLLEAHPEYALAHGAHVWARMKRGRLDCWPCYHRDNLAGLMQDDPADRLLAAFDPMVSLYYAVEHRQNLLDALDLCEGITNLNAFEMLLSAVKAINGKCARVPTLFCAVQERKSALKRPDLYDGLDIVASEPRYAGQWERLNTAIAEHLSLRAGMSMDHAREVTRESLDRFLRRQNPVPETKAERFRRKASKLAKSAARLVGLPDFAARRVMDAYLSRLEGDARDQYEALMKTIERGYREGW
jgi:glycosyltransferase domain-containing protein